MSLNLTSKTLSTILPFEDIVLVLWHDTEARYRFLGLVTSDVREGSWLLCGSCGKIYWFQEVGDRWIEMQCVHWTMRRRGVPASVGRGRLKG